MKKKYLKTVEDVIALKDTNTKIYECSDKNTHYEFVNGCFCRFDGNGDIRFNDSILITNDIGYERYYILEEEPIQEATEEDVGKLCWFGDIKEVKRIGILEKLDLGDKEPYQKSEGFWYKHCHRLSPAEVAEITGYKVEEK